MKLSLVFPAYFDDQRLFCKKTEIRRYLVLIGDKKEIRTRNGGYGCVQIYFTGFEGKHNWKRKQSVLIWAYLGKQLKRMWSVPVAMYSFFAPWCDVSSPHARWTLHIPVFSLRAEHCIKERVFVESCHLSTHTQISCKMGRMCADLEWMQNIIFVFLITEEQRLSSAFLVTHPHIQLLDVI